MSARFLDRWCPSFVNRVALKIAAGVAVGAGVSAILGLAGSLWTKLGTALGAGVLTYAVAHYWLHRRLQWAGRTLQQIRRHDFESLPSSPGPETDELGKLQWAIYRTGQKLEDEIQDFKERESYRREFIGNVSHELKTPIFSVQGFAETLLDGALDDDAVNRTFLKKILRNVTRLENLARDLSAITKIETGELEMSREPFEIGAVFEEVQESVELKADEKEVALRFEVEDELADVYGDRGRIRRVIVNLADNAIKYNEAGGTVTLQAEAQAGDGVAVRVVDDGIGIPEEHLPRLTERFYRVDKSRSRDQGGTGLGLAIVKHILAAHDRSLRVESTPGEGSTFEFTLPTTPQPALESA